MRSRICSGLSVPGVAGSEGLASFAATDVVSDVWAGCCPVLEDMKASATRPEMEIREVVRQVCILLTTRVSDECSYVQSELSSSLSGIARRPKQLRINAI